MLTYNNGGAQGTVRITEIIRIHGQQTMNVQKHAILICPVMDQQTNPYFHPMSHALGETLVS